MDDSQSNKASDDVANAFLRLGQAILNLPSNSAKLEALYLMKKWSNDSIKFILRALNIDMIK